MNIVTEINIQNREEVKYWSGKLECSEEELLYCISKVGSSINSIESYLQMNKSLLQYWASKEVK